MMQLPFRVPMTAYRFAGMVTDNEGHLVRMLQPPVEEVVRVADLLADGVMPWPDAELPVAGANLWDADNLGTVGWILSGAWHDWRGRKQTNFAVRIRGESEHALLWLVAGYLTVVEDPESGLAFGAEQLLCNGSTAVPDLWEAGYVMKDLPAVAHDEEWSRRAAGIPDVFGRAPDFHRGNSYYRDVLAGLGHERAAAVRFAGLESPIAMAKWQAGLPQT